MEVIINTLIDTALLYYENTHSSGAQIDGSKVKINLVTDFIFLGIGNFILSTIADPSPESITGGSLSNRLHTSLKAAYFPVSSALMFSAYSNMMYNNSYIRSFTITAPIMIGETYINYTMLKEKKQEEQEITQQFFKTNTLLGHPKKTV